MAESGDNKTEQMYPKTHAKELYCLGDKDLEPLPAKEKKNPYVSRGTPMKLYKQSDLEEAATHKWGSMEELEKEKQKRVARKERKELEKAQNNEKDDEERALEDPEAADDPKSAKDAAISPEGKLHPLLAERIQRLKTRKGQQQKGTFVLYWMRTAVRDHDNPALDAALCEAKARKLPLLCMSTLMSKSHTHPTHRRFKFLLEGLKDVQASFQSKGIPHLIYVEGLSKSKEAEGEAWQALAGVASKADLVVTELMPTPPYSWNLQDLVKQVPESVEVWAVDTACVVPVTLSKHAYSKAYAYRNGTSKLRKERLSDLPYSGQACEEVDQDAAAAVEAVPWDSVDLSEETDMNPLLEKAGVFDASVPGVDHMLGGQTAGYARWDHFRKTGLSQYAARRNNPMLRSGVSRMSAYHHFGMVSPFRVAREADGASSSGARKFADEFMTWREVAYCFCHHNASILESLEVLPPWAQKTLNAHKGDKRDLKTLEQLEKGTTGDKIWDALQHQLNVTGELHNNVRMTWGKALLPWTSDPETALKQTCHLNHKFALDGLDPSSYGGILWCFGQFDGPKGAESTPILGSLRNRPTHLLSRKLDPARFRDLPLDATTAKLVGDAAAAEGASTKKDIRSLFAQAGHQGDDGSGANEQKAAMDGEDDSAANGASGGASPKTASKKQPPPKSPAKKRKDASQPGIQKFFKRAK